MQKVRNRTVESGRGALGCYIVSDDTPRPYRLAEIDGIEWFWQTCPKVLTVVKFAGYLADRI